MVHFVSIFFNWFPLSHISRHLAEPWVFDATYPVPFTTWKLKMLRGNYWKIISTIALFLSGTKSIALFRHLSSCWWSKSSLSVPSHYCQHHKQHWCRSKAVNFLQNPHKWHLIAHPLIRDMGCLFWRFICMSFVNSIWDLYFASAITVPYMISWHIGPHYSGPQLYAMTE